MLPIEREREGELVAQWRGGLPGRVLVRIRVRVRVRVRVRAKNLHPYPTPTPNPHLHRGPQVGDRVGGARGAQQRLELGLGLMILTRTLGLMTQELG